LVEAGAQAVKAEGGRSIINQVDAIVSSEAFLSWDTWECCRKHVLEEGGYKNKGKVKAEQEALLADANALVEAGAFAVVLELVAPSTARELTRNLPIPTIGIGSGPDCDGQILVTPDLLGMLPWFSLKHVKPKLNAAEQIRKVVMQWRESGG
jgi:3-methyl-2-oxobutanoate hydroxymethyltransferase